MGGNNTPRPIIIKEEISETIDVLKIKVEKLNKIEEALSSLKSHPNYKDLTPFKDETLTAFTLRCAAHLVSPPMYEGESNEMECIDVASAILAIESEVTHKWVQSHAIGGINETEIKIDEP